MMTETTFSHDSDLEEAVIGACMIERAAMPLVADKLRPEMFYEEKNLEIFAALQSMYRSAKSIDTITLKNELAARGKLDAVGGPYELLRISSKVSSSAHLEYHALILRPVSYTHLHADDAAAADVHAYIAGGLQGAQLLFLRVRAAQLGKVGGGCLQVAVIAGDACVVQCPHFVFVEDVYKRQ